MPKKNLVGFAARLTPENNENLKAYAAQNNVSANTALNALLEWALATVTKKEWGISVNMGSIEQSRKPRQPRQPKLQEEPPVVMPGQLELPTPTVNHPVDDPTGTKKISLGECETHQDLIVYAAQKGKSRSWAYGVAKGQGYDIVLSVEQQDEIWNNNQTAEL